MTLPKPRQATAAELAMVREFNEYQKNPKSVPANGRKETFKDRLKSMRSPDRGEPELMYVPMTDAETDRYARIARAYDAAKAVKTDKKLIEELKIELVWSLHTQRGYTTFASGGVSVTIDPNITSSDGLPNLTVVVKR